MIAPAGTLALNWLVTVPTLRLAVVSAVVAALCCNPTTAGTLTPDDTTISTALPVTDCVPPAGLWLTTTPTATVVLACVEAVPTTRLAFVIDVVAAA